MKNDLKSLQVTLIILLLLWNEILKKLYINAFIDSKSCVIQALLYHTKSSITGLEVNDWVDRLHISMLSCKHFTTRNGLILV